MHIEDRQAEPRTRHNSKAFIDESGMLADSAARVLSEPSLSQGSQQNDHYVGTELGRLRRIIIHAPDVGVGVFPPRAMRDLLYDDIVDYNKICAEYSEYLELLYWFLDPNLIRAHIAKTDKPKEAPIGLLPQFDPACEEYLRSHFVLDIQDLLTQTCENPVAKAQVIAGVCGLEGLGVTTQELLISMPARELAQTLVSGMITKKGKATKLFAPVTNLIFTRDTAVAMKDHLFITRPKERARARESLLTRYALAEAVLKGDTSKLLQLERSFQDDFPDFTSKLTIEGGDVMMIAPNHLLVGLSARTNHLAIEHLVALMVQKGIVDKVSVIALPHARDFMHIDTVFTQIKRGLWVVFGPFSRAGHEAQRGAWWTPELDESINAKPVKIFQYRKASTGVTCRKFDFLDDLLTSISKDDQGHKGDTEFIYCGDGLSAIEEREQWMDGCNFLALAEGVVVGYDRNHQTTLAFRERGFQILDGAKLNCEFREGKDPQSLLGKDTLILLPSAELSRARGGTHCMSLPLLRDSL